MCTPLVTECFASHFHAFEVSKSTISRYVSFRHIDLADHNVFSLYALPTHSNNFVSVKYNIVENLYF